MWEVYGKCLMGRGVGMCEGDCVMDIVNECVS